MVPVLTQLVPTRQQSPREPFSTSAHEARAFAATLSSARQGPGI